jgi:hypothetical protein
MHVDLASSLIINTTVSSNVAEMSMTGRAPILDYINLTTVEQRLGNRAQRRFEPIENTLTSLGGLNSCGYP